MPVGFLSQEQRQRYGRYKELLSKSERDGKKARLRTLKDLDTAALQLSQACQVLLNPHCEPDQVIKCGQPSLNRLVKLN